MANRYWVGGTATWDGTAGTKWSATSGGSSGASAPTAADDVFFDANSGAGTVTVGASSVGKSLNCTGFTGTLTGSATYTIAGSITLSAGMTYSHSGAVTITGTGTITTAGKAFSGITVNGSGITVSLGDAYTSTSRTITVTSGTFTTTASNYALSASRILVQGGTLTLNASTVTLAFTTPLSYTSGTVNAGTSTINLTSATAAFAGGGQTYYDVAFTATGYQGLSITGANTFNNLGITGLTSFGAGLARLTLSADQTVNGTFTINGSSTTNGSYRTFVLSSVAGTARTLTCAAVSLLDVDFQDTTIAGAAAPASGTRLGDCKGNSGITFTSKTVYWNSSGGGNWSNGWAATSGGTAAPNNLPLAQDTAIFEATGLNSGSAVTLDSSWNIGTVDMSARTSNTMTLSVAQNISIYGNWINGTGTTISGTAVVTLAGRGSQSLTGAGKTFSNSFVLNSIGGTLVLQDAVTTNRNAAGAFTLTNGTLDLNGKTLSLSGSTAATFLTATGTKNITFNGGTLSIAANNTTAFNNAAPTGFTTTAGTGTGSISMTGTSQSFVGGGSTFNCALNRGNSGSLTLVGANTFSNITNSYAATGATTILFPIGATTTVADFTGSGTSGKLFSLLSELSGTKTTIAYSGATRVSSNFLSVRDLDFTPFATDGTAPYRWYAGASSTNSGNNTGIAFVGSTSTAYLITSGTSWTVPVDWVDANNAIHLIGGGGGGAGGRTNRAAGGGGGGGGYSRLLNQTLTPSASITYAIGAAGGGGAAGADGTAGGTTSWNSGATTAGGGGGGQASTTPSSTGGTGGTGTTFNGGTGGAGAFGTGASTGYGAGGGGGAGGPNGAGGTGGNGFASTVVASVAGGGGGGNGGGSNGTNGASAAGGDGGNNSSGVGGATANGGAGTLGGGGGGNTGTSDGGAGGSGIDISNTVGGAGGKGGAGAATTVTANAGLYGGGGTGGGVTTAGTARAGGAGSQGMIFIIYGTVTPTSTGNFFNFFPI